jgi:hypothetical protein
LNSKVLEEMEKEKKIAGDVKMIYDRKIREKVEKTYITLKMKKMKKILT